MNKDLLFFQMMQLSKYYMSSVVLLVPLRLYETILTKTSYPSDLVAILILKYVLYLSSKNKIDYFNAINTYYIYLMVLMHVSSAILWFHKRVTLRVLQVLVCFQTSLKLSYWTRYTQSLGYTRQEARAILKEYVMSDRYACIFYPSYRMIQIGDWLFNLSGRIINYIDRKRRTLDAYVKIVYEEI